MWVFSEGHFVGESQVEAKEPIVEANHEERGFKISRCAPMLGSVTVMTPGVFVEVSGAILRPQNTKIKPL